jgi:hypothetical protein
MSDRQPDLVDDWGVVFHGRAETATGNIWWYEKDGVRFPLRPLTAVPTEESQP